jgi:hypothetical protein
VGRDSVVDIATPYGLDCKEIESLWRRDFLYPSRPSLGPTQSPIQGILVVKSLLLVVEHPPPSSTEVRTEYRYTCTPLCAFIARYTVNFTLTFTFYWISVDQVRENCQAVVNTVKTFGFYKMRKISFTTEEVLASQ